MIRCPPVLSDRVPDKSCSRDPVDVAVVAAVHESRRPVDACHVLVVGERVLQDVGVIMAAIEKLIE